ncbi:Cationic amino acid transporter 2, vacuolar, partial [Dichanthelium oligosanthes]
MGGLSWPDLQCLVRRKPAAASSTGRAEAADGGGGQRLAKTLSIPHLAAIGVGSTIGAGIYVLVGTVAREHTGPGLTVSFLIAGVAAALSALCYAELSCRFPSAGSAYHYSYICIGESYFPNGVSGVLSGSATLFFAFIGFDTVASTAEEVKNPQRDLPLGMGLTLSLCCFLYMMVSAVVVGLVPYHAIDPDTPISSAFAQYGMQWAEYVVSSGAVLALIASLIGGILPQPRIIMAMARDGLLPPVFSAVNRQTQVPILSTILTGTCAAILAFFMDVSQLAGMVSVGTLLAFTTVAISVLVVRYAPPYEMPTEVALAGTPESLTSYSGHSEQDEQILEDPFGNEAPTVSEIDSKVRRQRAIRSIVLICLGAIIFVSAASFSLLPLRAAIVEFLYSASVHWTRQELFGTNWRFYVPVGSIPSNMLHHRQRIPAYEPW